jgi:hypothetical protein
MLLPRPSSALGAFEVRSMIKRITIHDLAPKGKRKAADPQPPPATKPRRGRKWTKKELEPVTILNPGSGGKKR